MQLLLVMLVALGWTVTVDPEIAELQAAAMRSVVAAQQLQTIEAREYKPHVGQVEFHKSPARVRGIFTGNRWGKSFAAAQECNAWACGKGEWFGRKLPKPPVRVRVVGDGYEHGIDKIILPIFRQIVDPADLKGGSWEKSYSAGKHTLKYTNGSTIEFMSYKLADLGKGAQMFAGVALDLLWFDEHGPHSTWEENQARIGERPLHSILTLTPVLGETWEKDEIWDKWQAGDTQYDCFTGKITDNPHLSEQAVADYLASIKDPKMREVRESGIWIAMGGAVYAMWNDDVHFIPYDAERVRRCTKTVLIDPHPSKAEFVLWCGIDSDNSMFAYREYKNRATVREVCDDIRRLSVGEDIRRFFIDPHWGWEDKETSESKASLYQENKIPVQPAYNGPDHTLYASMRESLDYSPTLRSPGFAVMDTCSRLRWEFKHNRFKPQTEAMAESDRWKRIKGDDDFLVLAEYYIKSNPVYLGRSRPSAAPVLSEVQRG